VSLDLEAVRLTLLWLCERDLSNGGVGMPIALCANCGHDRYDHAVGGDADNPSPWPCNFPHSRGAPAILCYCGDYQPSGGDEYGYPGGEAT
jgi:hypothetical protein